MSLASRVLRCGATPSVLVLFTVSLLAGTSQAGVQVSNLVTDDQTVNAATIADTDLKNAWGVSYSPTGPFWVSDNATGKATIYSVDPGTNVPVKAGLVVSIPGDGSITGQAFNAAGASNFNGDLFLFVSEDGTVSGWRSALGSNAEVLALSSPDNVYQGAAFASVGGNGYLYAANFKTGRIDVLKGATGAPDLPGSFTDPTIPSGYAPFNIENLGGTLYVTYAQQDAAKHDDVPGAGHGFVTAFDTSGNFLQRIASAGVLNSPWGLAIAPAGFEGLDGDLLVGNFGDGTINAFNLTTLANDGPLKDTQGATIAIDGLWALAAGNGGQGGNTHLVYFTAGPGDETHGLFGSLASVPEPSAWALFTVGAVGVLVQRKRRASWRR
ncbi:MAG: TIGR03118 family protein [Planctomycetia bacterium]|nr:TIGR03118 family protein [Planctomycetia bacterium]